MQKIDKKYYANLTFAKLKNSKNIIESSSMSSNLAEDHTPGKSYKPINDRIIPLGMPCTKFLKSYRYWGTILNTRPPAFHLNILLNNRPPAFHPNILLNNRTRLLRVLHIAYFLLSYTIPTNIGIRETLAKILYL